MAWTKRSYQCDAQGSTRALHDDTGTISDAFTYDAWGNEIAHTGNTETPFQWNGRVGYYWGDDSETYQVRRRPYESILGKWKTVDPIWPEAGQNIFAYCLNKPVAFSDPSGLVAVSSPCNFLLGTSITIDFTNCSPQEQANITPTLCDAAKASSEAWDAIFATVNFYGKTPFLKKHRDQINKVKSKLNVWFGTWTDDIINVHKPPYVISGQPIPVTLEALKQIEQVHAKIAGAFTKRIQITCQANQSGGCEGAYAYNYGAPGIFYDNIYICPSCYSATGLPSGGPLDRRQRVRVILNEFSDMFGPTPDQAYVQSQFNTINEPAYDTNLDATQLINNSDTYAYFITDVFYP